jgi:hypothetical protein
MKYQLLLGYKRFIIAGEKWWEYGAYEKSKLVGCSWGLTSGEAVVYPEHNLLWISDWYRDEEGAEPIKTIEDFEAELPSLPRWETTRYAVLEAPCHIDTDDRVFVFGLWLYNCRTGERLAQ